MLCVIRAVQLAAAVPLLSFKPKSLFSAIAVPVCTPPALGYGRTA
jgi:hypothetical protein